MGTSSAAKLTEQSLRGTFGDMKLLDQYKTACTVRRLARRTIQTYQRCVEDFLRFHHDRAGRRIHPMDMEEPEVEAFLTHLAVNRHVNEKSAFEALAERRDSENPRGADLNDPPAAPSRLVLLAQVGEDRTEAINPMDRIRSEHPKTGV